MNCEEIRPFLAGYQDGELDPDQRLEVEKHLASCPSCRAELAALNRVKEVTEKVQYKDLPLEIWEGYWQSLYRRLERGLGWIFLSIGAVILLASGAFYVVRDFFADPSVAVIPKLGVGALIIGAVFLLVSVGRERIFSYRRDRYREVQR